MKKIIQLVAVCSLVLELVGCTSMQLATPVNRFEKSKPWVAEPPENIQIREAVTGVGCSYETLMLYKSGDKKFLENYGDLNTSLDRAKAAAAYKALFKDHEVNSDVLIHPVWEIERQQIAFGLIKDDVCVRVHGYRGVNIHLYH
jgi:hypothetical protein